jgi:hypothetical protein
MLNTVIDGVTRGHTMLLEHARTNPNGKDSKHGEL